MRKTSWEGQGGDDWEVVSSKKKKKE